MQVVVTLLFYACLFLNRGRVEGAPEGRQPEGRQPEGRQPEGRQPEVARAAVEDSGPAPQLFDRVVVGRLAVVAGGAGGRGGEEVQEMRHLLMHF